MTDLSPSFIIPPPFIASAPVVGMEALFPVRRIYCVGRNYAAHIREMGGDVREAPFFFQKPTDAIVLSGETVSYPPATEDFQYEIELVLAIGKGGRNITIDAAADHVFGMAAGIDLTRRDVQVAARNGLGKSANPSISRRRSGPLSRSAAARFQPRGRSRSASMGKLAKAAISPN